LVTGVDRATPHAGKISPELRAAKGGHQRQPGDRLLAEVHRVLRPSGVFAGMDATLSLGLRLIHWGGTLVAVNPEILCARFEAIGFTAVSA
jgi:hypothetical protein